MGHGTLGALRAEPSCLLLGTLGRNSLHHDIVSLLMIGGWGGVMA